MYVIGTAGHVDHGKSTLVKALTKIDPDRLQDPFQKLPVRAKGGAVVDQKNVVEAAVDGP